MGLEVVAILSNDQGRKSRARNNVPSEIIASNNLKELNQITTTTGDLPVETVKVSLVALLSASQMTVEAMTLNKRVYPHWLGGMISIQFEQVLMVAYPHWGYHESTAQS